MTKLIRNDWELYSSWMRSQRKSENTIDDYIRILKNIPTDLTSIKKYFGSDLKGRSKKSFAFRSYLDFSYQEEILSGEKYMLYKKRFPGIQRDKKVDNNMTPAIPPSEWGYIIKQGNNRVCKMALWIGLNFATRIDETCHIRIQDIDMDKQILNIKIQEDWAPKRNKERQLPFGTSQMQVLARFIDERKVLNIKHPYLLYTTKDPQKPLSKGNLGGCFKHITHGGRNITSHDLRRSAITNMYQSTNDIYLCSLFAGHSSINTTQSYLRIGQDKLQSRMQSYMNSL